MVIIGIVGILTNKEKVKMWDHLGPAFVQEFRGARFVLEQTHYNFFHVRGMRTFGENIVSKHDTGEDVLLVGHSMGGVVACAIASKFKKSTVVGVVTLNSPHCLLGGLFTKLTCCEEELPAPVVSFAATKDWMVPWGAAHPQAQQHIPLVADHEGDLIANKNVLAQRIAMIASATITKARHT